LNYEDDINIDEGALDVEWLEHSRLMFKYCEMTAEAHRKMDLSKENVDFTKARLDKEIRADPDAYGVVAGPRGITESAIFAAIAAHDEYRDANQKFLDCRYEYEVAQGAVKAFEHRKSALENLVRLHGVSYFAGPQVPRNLAEERQARDKVAQSRVRLRRGRE
jgi:hypothetical protein